MKGLFQLTFIMLQKHIIINTISKEKKNKNKKKTLFNSSLLANNIYIHIHMYNLITSIGFNVMFCSILTLITSLTLCISNIHSI